MAELAGTTAIVPNVPRSGDVAEWMRNSSVTVVDYDAAGKKLEYSAPLPDSADFAAWTYLQQVIMLKRGQWQACSIPDIQFGLSIAAAIGASPVKGEIFPTGQGRWGTSNKYKIRKARESGQIKFKQWSFRELDKQLELSGYKGPDLECTATVEVEGWEPLSLTQKLSEWYMPNNPNWKGRPSHMLLLNTLAHLCELVMPGATEGDEAPPLISPV